MAPKDLLQSLKNNLEREASTEIPDVSVRIDACECKAKATVAKFVEGNWHLFEVTVKQIGISPDVRIGV